MGKRCLLYPCFSRDQLIITNLKVLKINLYRKLSFRRDTASNILFLCSMDILKDLFLFTLLFRLFANFFLFGKAVKTTALDTFLWYFSYLDI